MRSLTASELQREAEGRRMQQEQRRDAMGQSMSQRIKAERIEDLKEAIACHDEQIASLEVWIADEKRRRDEYRAKLVALGASGDLT